MSFEGVVLVAVAWAPVAFVLSTTATGARSLLAAPCPTPVEDWPAPPDVWLLKLWLVNKLPAEPDWFTPSDRAYWLPELIREGLTGDSRPARLAPL